MSSSAGTSQAKLRIVELGQLAYREATRLQSRLVEERAAGRIPDTALLLEHPPVLTMGPRTEARELGMGEQWYRAQGIDVVETDRGGRVTYHGPGQSVLYAIVDLRRLEAGEEGSVRAYVRALERAMIGALAEHGLRAQVFDGLTGVWTAGSPPVPAGEKGPERAPVVVRDPELAGADREARKIGSIGIHVSRGISSHGLAVNVTNDLQPFEWVVPCGIDAARMTSLRRELESAETNGDEIPTASELSRSIGIALATELGRVAETGELPLTDAPSDQPGPLGGAARSSAGSSSIASKTTAPASASGAGSPSAQ